MNLTPLLDLIYANEAPMSVARKQHAARGYEGPVSQYNVVSSFIPIPHRPMAPLVTYQVGAILEWQRFVVKKGAKSSAAGAPQIIRKTLQGLVDSGKLGADERFDAAGQDKGCIALIEARGLRDYVANKIKAATLANALSREWASFPVMWDQQGANRKVKRGQSYYAGDGLNRAHATPEQVSAAVEAILAPEVVPEPDIEDPDLYVRVAALEHGYAQMNTRIRELEEA